MSNTNTYIEELENRNEELHSKLESSVSDGESIYIVQACIQLDKGKENPVIGLKSLFWSVGLPEEETIFDKALAYIDERVQEYEKKNKVSVSKEWWITPEIQKQQLRSKEEFDDIRRGKGAYHWFSQVCLDVDTKEQKYDESINVSVSVKVLDGE